MKTKILFLSLATAVLGLSAQAQYNTQVKPSNYEISDNLDLRAVASIFGESRDIEDFERKLNDPDIQISNLDLNDDDEVDYLRVIESVERNTHVVVIQAVLDRDVYQDVATIDLEKDRNNTVQIQFIGNEFMYGQNYIYEPTYYSTPLIYASFWSSNYRPYVSTYRWNYYPNYYRAWNPFPVFRYRNNISVNININNRYNYVNSRRSSHAAVIYNSRRANGYERMHPNYAFSRRNTTVINRYELDQNRSTRRVSSRPTRTYADNRATSRTSRTSSYENNRTVNKNGNYRTRSSATIGRSNPQQRSNSSRSNDTRSTEQQNRRAESPAVRTASNSRNTNTRKPNYSTQRSSNQENTAQRRTSNPNSRATQQRTNTAENRTRTTTRQNNQTTTPRNNRVSSNRTEKSSGNVSRSSSQRSESGNNNNSRRSSSSLENRRS